MFEIKKDFTENDLAALKYLLSIASPEELMTAIGDLSGDGKVDEKDLVLAKRIIAKAAGIDANADGVVDENDFAALKTFFADADLKKIRAAVCSVRRENSEEDVAAFRKLIGSIEVGGGE